MDMILQQYITSLFNLKKEYNQMKNNVIKSLLAGLIVFISGFGVMYLFWILGTYPKNLPNLFSYYSSAIGDSVFLPILSAGFTMFFLNSDYKLSKKQKIIAIIFGIIGIFSGIALQASWLINPDIGLNWTIPKPHHFNAAGWYHAVFLILMFAFVEYSLAKWWIIMYNKIEHNLKDVFINSIIWGSGAGFLYTFTIDNLKVSDLNMELYMMYAVLIIYILIFSILIGIALILKKNGCFLSIYISFALCLSAITISTIYLCTHKCSLDLSSFVIAFAAFFFSFVYLKPTPDEIKMQILKRIFTVIPVFVLTLVLSTCGTVSQLIAIGIINVAIFAFIANAQFHNLIYKHSMDTKIVKINIQYGSIFIIAVIAIMVVIKHNEYNALFSLLLTIIIETVGTRVITKYFNYVKDFENLQSTGTLELENIKKHVYITLMALFLGAFLVIIISIFQNTENGMKSIFYFPTLNCKSIIYFLFMSISACLLLIYTMIIRIPNKVVENKIMVFPIFFSFALYTSFIFFLICYIQPNFSLESFNFFTVITYISKLCLSLGIAFLIAEDFYSNAFIIYSKANRPMTLILSTTIGFYTFIYNLIILFTNKQQYVLDNDNHYCIVLYLIMSILVFSVFPTILATIIKIIIEQNTSIVLINYRINILFDGFLYLLIFTFAGLIPDLINCVIEVTFNKILLIISIFTLLVWVLSFCMKNNVTHYNERKNAAIQEYNSRISEENKIIVRIKFKRLLKHLRLQNFMSIIASLVYSAIIVLVFVINEYWEQNDNENKSFSEVFNNIKQRYWPSN